MKNSNLLTSRLVIALSSILLFSVTGCENPGNLEFRFGSPDRIGGGSGPAKTAGMGKIIRLDPRFDEIVPKGAVIEKLAGGFAWSEGPVWLPKEKAVLFSVKN